jgi:hypothetical protein
VSSIFFDTYYENASPLVWERSGPDRYDLTFVPDHERFSENCQLTHWNFVVEASPQALGRTIRLRFRSPDNTWNGRPNPPLRYARLTSCVSTDGVTWRPVGMEEPQEALVRKEMSLTIDSPRTQVCNVVPYTGSMLAQTLSRLAANPMVRVYGIGASVEKRVIEMVEIGNPDAKHRVLLRARAHPWETGGNWLLEGLYERLTDGDPVARSLLQDVCFFTVPMACKDGVYRGMTRYNVRGFDLNRGWKGKSCFDPVLCPENHALQMWLNAQEQMGRTPHLAICLHNDDNGKLHFPPLESGDPRHERLCLFENLLTRHTWFREGSVVTPAPDTTFAGGLFKTYDIDALIYELNASWSAGLDREVLHSDWVNLGRDMVDVFVEYFRSAKAQAGGRPEVPK